eukprot:jgi/Mesen1/7142/ME000037S06496
MEERRRMRRLNPELNALGRRIFSLLHGPDASDESRAPGGGHDRPGRPLDEQREDAAPGVSQAPLPGGALSAPSFLPFGEGTPGGGGSGEGGGSDGLDGFGCQLDEEGERQVVLGLRAAANCSNRRRRTALHVAVQQGNPEMVAGLLALGALPAGAVAKDAGGATPLFLAAELGHAAICESLLRGGADALASNRSGETALYIAALRGHAGPVDAMLHHCLAHAIDWQRPESYGDGWTPLMAAAVADRRDVGALLLQVATSAPAVSRRAQQGVESTAGTSGPAAGAATAATDLDGRAPLLLPQFCCLDAVVAHGALLIDYESLWLEHQARAGAASQQPGGAGAGAAGEATCAVPILNARNRYGQTALHIAARRPSIWFIANLLKAGATADVRDNYGRLPLDEARKHGHKQVEAFLQAWAAYCANKSSWGDAPDEHEHVVAGRGLGRGRGKKADGSIRSANKMGRPASTLSPHAAPFVPSSTCARLSA